MSTEVTTRTSGALVEKMEWSRAMAPGNLLPAQYRGNPANLLFAVEYADALGIERINAITAIHVIEGKPSASADLIAGLIRRAGHRLRISGDDKSAMAQIIRADDPEFVFEARWDLDRARQAGLVGKAVWKSYPAAMLRARAITEVARMGASDALLGVVYTPEELGAEVGADGLPTRPTALPAPPVTAAEIMQDTPVDVTASEVIEDAQVVDEPPADPITRPQSAKLHALLKENGADNRDAGLAIVSALVGHEVASTKDLTKDEASRVIDQLEADKAKAAPYDEAADAAWLAGQDGAA